MNRIICLIALMLVSSGVFSAESGAPAAVPEPPDLPPKVESGEVLEPEVRIIESDRGTVEEYSVNGRAYMLKITPTVGPAYYLIDTDGDGEYDRRQDRPGEISVPQWVIMSW